MVMFIFVITQVLTVFTPMPICPKIEELMGMWLPLPHNKFRIFSHPYDTTLLSRFCQYDHFLYNFLVKLPWLNTYCNAIMFVHRGNSISTTNILFITH